MNTEESEKSKNLSGIKPLGNMKPHAKDRSSGLRGNRTEKSVAAASTVKLPNDIYQKLLQLLTEANGDGPKRVQPKDLIDLALRKVDASDLTRLRSSKATVRDHFHERLKAFQAGDPQKTEEMFLAHLLKNQVELPITSH